MVLRDSIFMQMARITLYKIRVVHEIRVQTGLLFEFEKIVAI